MLTAHAIFQSDLHNLPQAFEAFSEALDLCDAQCDPVQSFSVWHNLAAALLYAELPKLAISASQIALEHAQKIDCEVLRKVDQGGALTNIAYACLFTKQYGLGLRSAKDADNVIEAARQAKPPSETHQVVADHCLLLTVRARLLQRVGLLSEARRCLERANELVLQIATYSRIASNIQLASALHDVYSGQFDKGVSCLVELISPANLLSPELAAGALRDLIEAHVVANRREGAADYMRRLGNHMRRVRSDDVLFHHRRHIDRLRARRLSDGSNGSQMSDQSSHYVRFGSTRGEPLGERAQVLEDLCIAAELHDDPSGRHPHRVAELARILGDAAGLAERAKIAAAAKLHDVGKVGVPALILRKPGPLLSTEYQIMQSHTTTGADLLASVDIDNREIAISIARHHHEWWSGCGYPDRLAGDSIPIAARVAALADGFDAMTHDRAYRPRLSVGRALELIGKRAGHQYDPTLAGLFCQTIQELSLRHVELDKYLERDFRESGFLQAKRRLTERLARAQT